MNMNEIIALNRENIKKAIEDYSAHTYETAILDDISSEFIDNLAEKSAHSKSALRDLFSKSPAWREDLQALVINGNRTHDPDEDYINELVCKILMPARNCDKLQTRDMWDIQAFFSQFNVIDDDEKAELLKTINRIAPKAYANGKKLSRVFKAICKALDIADETSGSDFQKNYALLADELSAKKIDFKLFVSINPAHFLTMSNPKYDNRGNTLTSCHSLNSTEYTYNCGCSGYACDETSFIVFTVDDPTDAETLNNRKTTRQIFAYKPYNGVLLQSRLYNTSGGTRGAQAESKVYRDLIQREICALENIPNLWITKPSTDDEYKDYVETGEGFGGYEDWIYSDFDGKISVRKNNDDPKETITIGTYGLCIVCGDEISEGLYCDDHDNMTTCDECGDRCNSDDLYRVYDRNGNEIWVCENCREDYYYCEECGEYHHYERMTCINDDYYVCDDCLDHYYTRCEECGEYYRNEDMTEVHKDGYTYYVCEDCLDDNFYYCNECGEYHHYDEMIPAHDKHGNDIMVCSNCIEDNYTECAECGEYFHNSHIIEVINLETGEIMKVSDDFADKYEIYNNDNEEVSA